MKPVVLLARHSDRWFVRVQDGQRWVNGARLYSTDELPALLDQLVEAERVASNLERVGGEAPITPAASPREQTQ